MNSHYADISRRHFVRHSCCAAVGTTGILSALGQLRVMAAVAGDSLAPATAAAVAPDYKALVCLFLQGGKDGTSLIVPSDASSYAAYATARADLAVDRAGLLPITPKKYADTRSYGFHASAPEIRTLFGEGRLAVLANVGMLVRPTTLADYKEGRNLPPQLFSHSDQALQWQSSVPDKPFESGWGGRLADLVDALNSNNQISMSITLSGANSFQRGQRVEQYAVGSGGAGSLSYSTAANPLTAGVFTARANGMTAILGNPQANALAAAFGSITKESISDGELLTTALRGAPTLTTRFPTNSTAGRLAMVAKLIWFHRGSGCGDRFSSCSSAAGTCTARKRARMARCSPNSAAR